MDGCTQDCIQILGGLSVDQMCGYTKTHCVQDTVQFVQMYYCTFHSSFILLLFLGLPLIYVLFRALNNLADIYLTPCVDSFIVQFRISPALAGVTFLTFANGAPDVLTAIVAGASSSDETALIPFGSIFGAYMFAAAWILPTCILVQSKGTLKVTRREVLIPLAFYIVGMMYLFFISLFYGKMNVYIASFLLFLYVIYILITLVVERKNKQKLVENLLDMDIRDKNNQTILTEEAGQDLQETLEKEELSFLSKINGRMDKGLVKIFNWGIPPASQSAWQPVTAIVSLIISPFSLALCEGIDEVFESQIGPLPMMLVFSIPAVLLLIHTIYFTVKGTKPSLIPVYTLYSFIITCAWLTLICSILINLFELLQLLSEINTVFLGLTVFAGVGSIGDYLTIVRFARVGNASTAIAGVFPGQLFNFLLGFGISLILQSLDGEYSFQIFKIEGTTFNILSDFIIMVVLVAGFINMIYMFVLAIFRRGIFQTFDANVMKIYYAVFIALAIILSVLTDFYNPIECDDS